MVRNSQSARVILLVAVLLLQVGAAEAENPQRPKSLEEAIERYGPFDDTWTPLRASDFLVTIKEEFAGKEWEFALHRDAAPSFLRIMKELRRLGLITEITAFYGCTSFRPIAGTSRISTHAYGLACDFNAHHFTPDFVRVWKDEGWCWGGDWKERYDPMHFSWAWEC